MEFVKIGKIVNTFGIRGELKIDNTSDFVSERYKKGTSVYLGDDKTEMKVKKYRENKGFLFVLFEDNEDINLVEKYKGQDVYKAKQDIPPLKKGEYYVTDIIGLQVKVNSVIKGKVIDMEEGVRYNNMRILTGEKEVLVPFLPNFIKEVDLKEGTIELVEMEGLL